MGSRTFLAFLLPLAFLFASTLPAQDLASRTADIQKRSTYFSNWLHKRGIDHIFKVDSVRILPHKATLYLGSSAITSCDSMELAWDVFEVEHFQAFSSFFHDSLLLMWGHIGRLTPNQTEVKIGCNSPPQFLVHLFGQAPKNTNSFDDRFMAKGVAQSRQVAVPESSVVVQNSSENTIYLKNADSKRACTLGRLFCKSWYVKRGTWFFNAEINEIMTLDNEFIIHVTYIKNDICPDGFFEFHTIHANFVQKGSDVAVQLEFDAKYGSGIIFAPRKNGYKDMESAYKQELENYQQIFFKLFSQAIAKQ